MTDEKKMLPEPDKSEQSSLLPVPSFEIRVRPADFARMVNVSKQTVSQWVKKGIICLGSDGRLEPKQATAEILKNTDPGRLRAKVLKPLFDDVGSLRQQLEERESQLEQSEKRVALLENCMAAEDCAHEKLLEKIIAAWPRLRELQRDAVGAALDELDDEARFECGA